MQCSFKQNEIHRSIPTQWHRGAANNEMMTTCKALDFWVVCTLSQGVYLLVQVLQLLPQAVQLNAHINRLIGLNHKHVLRLAQCSFTLCLLQDSQQARGQ